MYVVLISYISKVIIFFAFAEMKPANHMKKRHEQKLVVLSIALFLFFNIPFILVFNFEGAVFGIPTLYFSIFSIWLLSIVISYIVLKRHYE